MIMHVLLEADIYDRTTVIYYILTYVLVSCLHFNIAESFCPKFPKKCPKIFGLNASELCSAYPV